MTESFNSILMWMYTLELISESTEKFMIFSTTETEFKDVGLYTNAEWQLLVSRALSKFVAHVCPDVLTCPSRLCHSTGKKINMA